MKSPITRSHGARVLSPRTAFFAGLRLVAILVFLSVTSLGRADGQAAPLGQTTELGDSCSWSELGAKATAQHTGEGLAVVAGNGLVHLRCAFQRLEGTVTSEGLWLVSTAKEAGDRFQMRSERFGRSGGSMAVLAATGVARLELESGHAQFVRPGLVEEYSVSVDGVRQDFVVTERPTGRGALRVELSLQGARAEAAPKGARLVLEKSNRKLAYARLRVMDARDRALKARLEVSGPDSLCVVVQDDDAVYPVRIDPTFSDANWVDIWGGDELIGATVASWVNDSNNNGHVRAVAVDGSGNIYIGGAFTEAGGVSANRIAKWDGTSWSALGSGMDAVVYALAVNGTDLYAGGAFTTAGGTSASGIAKWNGSTWSALEGGVSGGGATILALAFLGSDLFVGGQFTDVINSGPTSVTVNNIAKWDGSEWSALSGGVTGSTVLGPKVAALAVSGSSLFVGGDFTNAGGSKANIAKWDGSSWSALGGGVSGLVLALAVDGTDLYVGGSFTLVDGGNVSANRIAKWDGSTWTPLNGGLTAGGDVKVLAVSGTSLYAGGAFYTANNGLNLDVDAPYVARWDLVEQVWSALGTGMGGMGDPGTEWYSPIVYALAVSGSDVFAGGNFYDSDNAVTKRIAKWNGTGWEGLWPPTAGMDDYVYAVAISGGDLYAGGLFTRAGSVLASHVAKWNGTTWSALGAGVDDDFGTAYVNALAIVGSDLYVGGNFTLAGGGEANRIAKWNGTTWSALTDGAENGVDDEVFALTVLTGELYVGGVFIQAGTVTGNGIAKWTGSAWSALESGVDDTVYALTVSGSDLYAGGSFTVAGSALATNVAKWNGTTWSALGKGTDGPVYALAASGSVLYAGGFFSKAGGAAAYNLAKWNGTAWSALGFGTDFGVYALAVSGSDLYLGGGFSWAGGTEAWSIAKWNGHSFSALGSGMNGFDGYEVFALVKSGTTLYAGGGFDLAGDKNSYFIAKASLPSFGAESPTLARARGLPLKIPIADLGFEPNGAALSVTALGAGDLAATLSYNSTYIFYTPTVTYFDDWSEDTLSYTLSNGSTTVDGTLIVSVVYPQGMAQSIEVSGGIATVTFFGVPGIEYEVQRTTDLTEPVVWETITTGSLTPSADGSFSFTDEDAPDGTAYYRCIQYQPTG